MRPYDGIKAERGREVNLEAPDFLGQARQLLSRNITLKLRMSGGSMRPAIDDGDVVTVEPLGDAPLRSGDIILYQSRFDTAVIHRVVRLERAAAEKSVITRGDAAAQSDQAVPLNRVLGRVKMVERAGERVKITKPRQTFAARLAALWQRIKSWFR